MKARISKELNPGLYEGDGLPGVPLSDTIVMQLDLLDRQAGLPVDSNGIFALDVGALQRGYMLSADEVASGIKELVDGELLRPFPLYGENHYQIICDLGEDEGLPANVPDANGYFTLDVEQLQRGSGMTKAEALRGIEELIQTGLLQPSPSEEGNRYKLLNIHSAKPLKT